MQLNSVNLEKQRQLPSGLLSNCLTSHYFQLGRCFNFSFPRNLNMRAASEDDSIIRDTHMRHQMILAILPLKLPLDRAQMLGLCCNSAAFRQS